MIRLASLFEKAAVRLAAWYVLILMVLSLSLSVVVYKFASEQLQGQQQHEIGAVMRQRFFLNDPDFQMFQLQRAADFENSQGTLLAQMIFFNLAVFGVGGSLALFLARRTMAPLEQSVERQRQFTANASHELRTPLATMRAELDLAKRAKEKVEEEGIDSLLEEIDRLDGLTTGMLQLASLEEMAGKGELVSLGELVESSVKQRKTKYEGTRTVSIHSTAKVRANPVLLKQVLSALLDNAEKYGEGKPINVSVRQSGLRVILEIEDQGVGIAKEDQHRIFERFYRSDKARTKGGYGIGLAIVRTIIEQTGGSVNVVSKEGEGSRFIVSLPIARFGM